MQALTLLNETLCFGGRQRTYQHASRQTACPMRFAVYLPPSSDHAAAPVVWWLSGLTCTEENFSQKSGAQRIAADLGLILVIPDTSPRGPGVPDDPSGAFDFGLGAGYYLDATQEPWSAHYRMYSYLTEELPSLLETALPADMTRQSILGHSMGGHGALTIGLKHPGRYKAVSAFAPILAPSQCPWGRKAFSHYLGTDETAWRSYDAACLIEDGARGGELLIDQGEADPWLETQLLTARFETVCATAGQPLICRRRTGYDHSFYFIATFIEDHLRWHAERLL